MRQNGTQSPGKNRYRTNGQPEIRRREMITNDETVVMVAEDKLVNFLPFPRALLQSQISMNAKLVYTLLLSRGTLSQRNGWADGDFRQIYVIYPVKELAGAIGRSETTVKRALKELEDQGLIRRKANQTTRANRIYLFLPADTADLSDDEGYAFDPAPARPKGPLEPPKEEPAPPDLLVRDQPGAEAPWERPAWGSAEEDALAELLAWDRDQGTAPQEKGPEEEVPQPEGPAGDPAGEDLPPEGDACWPTDADVPPEDPFCWPTDADVPPEDPFCWPTDADVPPEEDAWWPGDEDAPPEDPVWCPDRGEAPAFLGPEADRPKDRSWPPDRSGVSHWPIDLAPPRVQV